MWGELRRRGEHGLRDTSLDRRHGTRRRRHRLERSREPNRDGRDESEPAGMFPTVTVTRGSTCRRMGAVRVVSVTKVTYYRR